MTGKTSFNKQYHNQNQYIFGKVKDVPNLSSSTNLNMPLDGSAPRYQNTKIVTQRNVLHVAIALINTGVAI